MLVKGDPAIPTTNLLFNTICFRSDIRGSNAPTNHINCITSNKSNLFKLYTHNLTTHECNEWSYMMHDYSLHSCIDLTSMISSVSSTHHMPYDKYFTITIPEGSGPSPSHIYSTREPFIVIAIYSTWLQSAASSNPSYLFPAITISDALIRPTMMSHERHGV